MRRQSTKKIYDKEKDTTKRIDELKAFTIERRYICYM